MGFTNFFSRYIPKNNSKKSKIANNSGNVKVGYFKDKNRGLYLSTVDMILYDVYFNDAKKLGNIKGSANDPNYSRQNDDLFGILSKVWTEISKEEFDNNFKNIICDCPVGEGTNIKFGAKYNIYDEFIKLYPHLKDLVEDFVERETFGGISNEFIIDGNEYSFTGNFYKKACLNCGKCLSDYEKLKKEFEKIINRIKELKIIEEICG